MSTSPTWKMHRPKRSQPHDSGSSCHIRMLTIVLMTDFSSQLASENWRWTLCYRVSCDLLKVTLSTWSVAANKKENKVSRPKIQGILDTTVLMVWWQWEKCCPDETTDEIDPSRRGTSGSHAARLWRHITRRTHQKGLILIAVAAGHHLSVALVIGQR